MEEDAPVSVSDATAQLELWRNFDLDVRKVNLDKSCVEMREAKTASISGRRRLNDITKAFRAKPREDQVTMMTELLKAYQEEIDQLSRRSKNCETTFFSLYKALYEMPDPSLCIDSLLNTVMTGSVHTLEIERLRTELAQYEEEFRQLKNQDITIRRLEDQLAEFKEQNEDKIQEAVAVRIVGVQARADERVSEAADLQRSVERRYQAAVEAMQQAQLSADHAQTQLYEVSSQAERKITALQSENALLAEGTQRQALRVAELESAQQGLQQSIAQLRVEGDADREGESAKGSDQDEDIQTLHLVVSNLREQLAQAGDAARGEKQRLEAASRDSTQQLAKERELLQRTRQELSERPSKESFQAVKRQLKMVQKIAFNVQDEEEQEQEREREDDLKEPETTPSGNNALEALLAARMKNLESDLTSMRRELQGAREQEGTARETNAALKRALSASQEIIRRLEEDLEARSAALEASVAAAGMPEGSGEGDLDLAKLLGVEEPAEAAKGNQINMQMIHILQSQRDQYKEKLTRAETSLQRVQLELESAQAAKSRLEIDNLALYSKVRYLQSYGASSSGPAFTSPKAMRISNRPDGEDVDLEGRYSSIYEERMNPFDQFSQREKQRKIQELTVTDRIILNTTMAVVSNQTGRNFLMMYLGAMHLLVFFTMYYLAHSSHTACNPSLDHMSPQQHVNLGAATFHF
ncbi:CASP C terminal-domain-containing protein [Ochromonadaceae sp. CCMP2298]|nr:CASP C terminal-domain-containing protein [Ochromonadaceae sp. CCMP2298]